MQCFTCGGLVLWTGQFSLQARTECQKCGAIDNQVVDVPDDEEEQDDES